MGRKGNGSSDASELAILIVEDNGDDAVMYRRYLKRDSAATYSFLEAGTGAEGLEELENNSVDCILLDYVLPDIDGLEFLSQKARRAEAEDVPVVFLTGFGNEMTAVEALKRGAVDYLVKDRLTEEVLSRAIRYALQHSRDMLLHREQTLFLETLVETIPSPLFYKDKDGRYRGCNRAFAEYFDCERETILGKSDSEVLPSALAQRFTALHNEQSRGPEERSFEISFTAHDGTPRHVIVNKAIYTNVDGAIEGSVGVIVDITARKRAEEQIRYLALYDDLTRLPNRRLFFERMHQALLRAARNKSTVGLLYMDLNGFKPINDRFGHEAGDDALRIIGERLPKALRDSDTAARIGGDEFAVILPDLPGSQVITPVAEKIGRSIAEPMTVMGHTVAVEASIGISAYPEDGMDVDKLLNQADAAMYRAKRSGRYVSRDTTEGGKE